MKKHFKLLAFIATMALLVTSCSVSLAPTSRSRRSRSSSSSGDFSTSESSSSESSSEATIYTITWKNYDGTVLRQDPVYEGDTPVYQGNNPTKASDAQYDYTFSGWTPEVGPATGDREYTATYSSQVRRYTVVWKNYDDSIIETDENVPYGTTPHFDGANPTRQSSVSTVYIFDGWTPEITDVTGNVSYTAKYREEVRKYTVTWKNYDGSTLKQEQVNYGVVPSYSGDMPQKESDAQYNYTFSGWSPSLVAVESDATYTAQFDHETRIYSVTWKNYDGSTLKVDQVAFGEMPAYDGDEPTKEQDSEYVYVFEGWSPELTIVEGDVIYTAQFRAETRKYTITWKNYDGSTLKSEQVAYGVLPEYIGDVPQKPADFEFVYAFSGWSPTVVPVIGDAEYTAQFSQETRTYTITWKNYDGTVLEIDNNLLYGDTPHYDGETPTRENEHGITYTFKGWDQTPVPVWCDATYTATYNSSVSFSFDVIPYEMNNGYELSDLRSAPWVNVNLEGEINKIKKPSPKDDFYTYVNYDNIKSQGGYGPFNYSASYTRQALDQLFNQSNGTTNIDYFYSFAQKLGSGDTAHVNSYLNSLDVDTYLSSKDVFVSNSSLLKLKPLEDGYEVQYNDGYNFGTTGIHTLLFFSYFSNYSYLRSPTTDITNTLYDSFGLNVSDEDYDDLQDMELDLTYSVYTYIDQHNKNDAEEYTVETLPWVEMKESLLDLGLLATDKITIRDCFSNSLSSLYNGYSLDTVKLAIVTRLAFDYRFFVGADTYKTLNQYITQTGFFSNENNLSGYTGMNLYCEMAAIALQSITEQMYIELSSSEEIKAKVNDLIEDVLQGYNDLVDDMDWLTTQTKDGIRRKLNHMAHTSCYADAYKNFPKLSTANKNSTPLFTYYGRYTDALLNNIANGIVTDDDSWRQMPSYTVNAYYSSTTNEFVILNGLVSGFLSDNTEEFYGMLGFVIGHEITHAFDSSGSQFDEYGNYSNWWASTDSTKFTNKVNKLIRFWNKIDQFDGNYVNGDLVDGEATADMGGIRVMLKLAESIPDFDYDRFFRACAYTWSTPAFSQSYLEYRMVNDPHPFEYLRTNVTLAQFQEFIDTYDIGPGDGMYIPENERIAIW